MTATPESSGSSTDSILGLVATAWDASIFGFSIKFILLMVLLVFLWPAISRSVKRLVRPRPPPRILRKPTRKIKKQRQEYSFESSTRNDIVRFFKNISGNEDGTIRDIPERTIEDIKQQQDNSEGFAALLQIGLTILFGAFYAFSLVKTGAPFSPLSPVPVTLLVYLAFGIVRLMKSVSGYVPLSFLFISLFADFGLLVVFSLVFPDEFLSDSVLISLAFIFIALRTFRFQPVWVLSAGGCGLFAWLVLLALGEGSGGFYVHGNLLVFLNIIAVTAILSTSQIMAKRNLYKSALSQIAVEDLSHFFDEEVVDKILTQVEGPNLAIAEKRVATIMFIDMRGFSKTSATLSAEEVVRLIKTVQSIIVPIIRKYGGTIDKFMGDGILASFGAVSERDVHAAAAIQAAHKILKDYTYWRLLERNPNTPNLEIGIGMATGEVVFGIIGAEQRYEYTVIGDAVNTAAKLEKQTKKQKVWMLCDDRTAKLAQQQGSELPLKAFEDTEVDGLSGKVTVWGFQNKDY